jgi:hypothetical protein
MRVARKKQSKRFNQIDVLLLESRAKGANSGKGVSPCFGAKTAGNLLFEFHHANISLGLIIVEGHLKIDQKASQELAGSFTRQQLVVHQIDHHPFEPRTILDSIAHLCHKLKSWLFVDCI